MEQEAGGIEFELQITVMDTGNVCAGTGLRTPSAAREPAHPPEKCTHHTAPCSPRWSEQGK